MALLVLAIALLVFFFATEGKRGTSTPQPPAAGTSR
jgi:hypothetical protein